MPVYIEKSEDVTIAQRTKEQRTRKDRATQPMDHGRLRWAIAWLCAQASILLANIGGVGGQGHAGCTFSVLFSALSRKKITNNSGLFRTGWIWIFNSWRWCHLTAVRSRLALDLQYLRGENCIFTRKKTQNKKGQDFTDWSSSSHQVVTKQSPGGYQEVLCGPPEG